jgi:hypothetical protein
VGERSTYTDADCWLAAANLILAATEVGLGSCCIGFAIPVLNTPDVLAEIGLPAAGVAVAPILIGYPVASTDGPKRRTKDCILESIDIQKRRSARLDRSDRVDPATWTGLRRRGSLSSIATGPSTSRIRVAT